MKILDLTNLENSEIKYKISQFPDSQQSTSIVVDFDADRILIKSRLSSFKDLELIICAVQDLRNRWKGEIHLFTPYFLGARSDRAFQYDGLHYLKQVICPIINSLELDSIIILDPHSNVLEGCLNNFSSYYSHNFYTRVFGDLGFKHEKIVLVAPDAGAYKRVEKVQKSWGSDIITCNKTRNLSTGEITGLELNWGMDQGDKTFVIVDDICDGGRTFEEVAKAIRKSYPSKKKNPIILVVTHGIFSKGYTLKGIDKIYTTNSFKEMEKNEYFNVYNIFEDTVMWYGLC